MASDDKLQTNLLWADAAKDDSIVTMEHPLTEMTLSKDQFYSTFGPVLDLLDGTDMSSYVDFFFERNPVQLTHLKYSTEEAKQDFLDWAIEEKCMPTVKEANQGEDDSVRKARLAAQRAEAAEKKAAAAAAEESRSIQAAKRKAKAAATDPALVPSIRITKMLGGLHKLKAKAKPPKPEKLQRAVDSLQAAVDEFVAAHPASLHLLPLELVPEDAKAAVQAKQEELAAATASAATAAEAAKAAAAAVKSATAAAPAAAAASAPEPEEAAPAAVEAVPARRVVEASIGYDSDDSSDDDSSSDDGSSSDEDE